MIAVAGIGSEFARGLADISQVATGSLVAAVWQGVLLAGAAWLGLRLLPKTPAAVRFAIWFGVFALVTALPVISLWPRGAGEAAAMGRHGAWLTVDARWSLAIAGVWGLASVWRAGQLMVAAARVRGLWKRATSLDVGSADGIHPTHRDTAAMDGAPGRLRRSEQKTNAGILPAPASKLAGDPVRFAQNDKSVRRAQICVSDEIDKPTVIGFLAPKILIPAWLLEKLTPAELEQIVLHESGHLGRADDWMNLLQKIALVIFPLNPALAWVERRLCFERELACDEWVLRAIAGRPGASTAYAACLASMAEYRLERRGLVRGLALALGLLGRESELARRVKRILRRGEAMRPAHAKLVLGGAMLVLVAGAAGLERCPQLVGFATEQGTAVARGQRTDSREQASAAGEFGYQAVMVRSNAVAPQQFRSIGDAQTTTARVRTVSKTRQSANELRLTMAKAAVEDEAVAPAAPAERVDVTQRSHSAANQGARMVRTVQHDTRQPQDGDVVVTQWVMVTQWRDGDGTRMVMTTARQVMNGADQQAPTTQDSGQQLAVPVRGGWLVFQM
jgi:hypothetical protein